MSRRATRNSENEDSDSFKEESLKWNKVAEMIGGTLEDVYNMDGKERNALLSLLPSEDGTKENNEQFVDLKPLLNENDNSDGVKLQNSSSSDQGSGTDDSASPHHLPVVNQKLNKSLEVVVYGAGVSKIQDLDEIEIFKDEINEMNVSFMDQMPSTQRKNSDEMETLKNAHSDESSMGSKEVLTDDAGLESPDESKPWQAYSVVKENYDNIIGSISKFQHVEVDKNMISKVPSCTDCFKIIEESPENYKFDINKAYDTNITKSNVDASLKGILKLFSGVKHIKSQAVASVGEELQLVTVHPNGSGSVRNGFQCLMPRIKGMSDVTGPSSPVNEPWWKRAMRTQGVDSLGRTRASASQPIHSQSSYNVNDHDYEDSVYNIDEYDFDGDDEVNNKPGTKANGKGKKGKGRGKGKRKRSETEDAFEIIKEKSKGRGKAASKEFDVNDDETEPSRAESPSALSSSGTSIEAHNTAGNHQSSLTRNTGNHQPTMDKTGHHQSSVDKFEALSSLAAGTSSSSVESTLTEEFAICPTCRSAFLVMQVEKHLTQSKGDVHQVEGVEENEKDFCNVCAQMVSLSSFEDHEKVCSGDSSLYQRILKKIAN